MVITNELNLPTEAELTTQEIKLSGAALRAGAFHLGKSCENENNVNTATTRLMLLLICTRDNVSGFLWCRSLLPVDRSRCPKIYIIIMSIISAIALLKCIVM